MTFNAALTDQLLKWVFTKLAEEGKGCALRDQLQKMTFEESLATMKQLIPNPHAH
jgi:hypothetical protein